LQYAQIVLPLNLKGSFTYKVPEELMSEIQPGMRVLFRLAERRSIRELF
jgi:primosomal protein N' (replication factor Y)